MGKDVNGEMFDPFILFHNIIKYSNGTLTSYDTESEVSKALATHNNYINNDQNINLNLPPPGVFVNDSVRA